MLQRFAWTLLFAFCTLFAPAAAVSPAAAEPPVRVEYLDHGILASGDGLAGKTVQVIRRTDRIPGKAGLAFGVTYRLGGHDDGERVSYQTVIRFQPARGVATGKLRPRITGRRRGAIGEEQALWHRLDAEQAALPGRWTMRVSQGGRTLLEKTFLVTPE